MDADVIVVGAGAAGMAAARRLAAAALRVVVLEARRRVGGRIWPRRLASDAFAAELGAEFIHGRAMETMALLRECGATAIDTGGEFWERDPATGALALDESFSSPLKIFESARDLDADESVERFLQRFNGDGNRRAVEVARAFVEGFDAADPAIASVRAIACELHSGVDSISARPLGGYGMLLDALHNGCLTAGATLRLSTVVSRIEWRRNAVAVTARTAWGAMQTLHARAAIVTLPVGVLRAGDAVEFKPELPREKRDALTSIEMGHVVRVALWFRSPFWERIAGGRYRDGAFFRSPDLPFSAYWTQVPVRAPLLVAWAGGPGAAAMSQLAPQRRIEVALDGCATLFGNRDAAYDAFELAETHDWMTDPFARGAYSYVRVNGEPARAELAEPLDDALYFAGEATAADGQGGTVNGALESGERAAAMLIERNRRQDARV